MPIRANRAACARRTQTGNAVMTTLASPTHGDAKVLSMWHVEMAGGQRESDHTIDSEQIWHVVRGELSIAIEQESVRVTAGDTLVLPESLYRRVTALSDVTALVCGFGDAIVAGLGEAGSTPPWIA
jgi:quercetin dioxygenase-like cupin family protein